MNFWTTCAGCINKICMTHVEVLYVFLCKSQGLINMALRSCSIDTLCLSGLISKNYLHTYIYIYVYTHYDLYTTLNIPPPVGWSRIFIYTVISYTIMIYWSWCITCNIKNMQTMNTTLTCGLLRYVFELNEHHAGTTSNCIYIILHITIVARSRMCIHSCKELQTCTV